MHETVIHNAIVVKKDQIIDRGGVALQGHLIKEVSSDPNLPGRYPQAQVIDAQGAYLLPGFIDTHSDNIERVIQPRPQSMIDFELAMREQEKELVNQGITSMYHSLSIMEVRGKSAVRSPENMKRLAGLIRSFHEGEHLIRHRFHCRYDLCNLNDFDMLLELLANGYIHYLSFTDHTPGQGQYRDVEFFKNHVMGGERPDEEKEKYIQERMNREKLTQTQLKAAADLAAATGIPIASHDDDSIEKLEYVMRELHATISEFPVELSIAKEARKRGMQVVVGAPNILMGRSHSNNLSATVAVKEGCADILVSDYFPPAILHAVFKLYKDGLMPLCQAVNMASYNPARAMRVGDRLGSIEEGKWGDLMLVAMRGSVPAVLDVFIGGQQVSSLRYRNDMSYGAGESYAG